MSQEHQAQNLVGSDGMFDDMVANATPQGPSEQQPEEEGKGLYAGKYKTPEELAEAYKNLERKLGMRPSPAEEAAAESQVGYTAEEAAEVYGPTVAEAAERAGLDLAEWDTTVRSGGDTSAQRAALARELGISESVIEDYERAFRPQEDPPVAGGGDVAALVELAGGEAGWRRLDAWATKNLGKEEIAIFNEALASTTSTVAEFAVRSLMARASGAPQSVEPIAGSAPAADVFKSQEEIRASRFKKDGQGRVLYETDPAYRDAHRAKIARSKLPI